METEGADEGPAEAEAELSEYNYADGYGYDYNRAKSSPSGGVQNRWGTFGHTIWPSEGDAGWPSNRAQNAKIEQFGTGNSNANIGQFGGGNKNANVVQGRGGWGGSGFGQGWPPHPPRHWPGTGSGRGRPGGTANANIVQGPGGPRGRLTQDASGCRCYFKGKPCSGRGMVYSKFLLQNTDSNRDYSDNIIEINPSQMIVGSG